MNLSFFHFLLFPPPPHKWFRFVYYTYFVIISSGVVERDEDKLSLKYHYRILYGSITCIRLPRRVSETQSKEEVD